MAELKRTTVPNENSATIPLLPVGSVYQTIDECFNPNGYFPGNWECMGKMECFDTHVTLHVWFRRE